MVSNRLDITRRQLVVSVQSEEDAPPVSANSGAVARRLRVLDNLVRIAEEKLDDLLVSEPLTGSLELLLALLVLSAHLLLDLPLQVAVDSWNKVFVEVRPAHRAGHTMLNDALVALEAHKVPAWCQYWLSAKFVAYEALIVVALRAEDDFLLTCAFCGFHFLFLGRLTGYFGFFDPVQA